MTAILVVFTIVVFLVVDQVVSRRRRPAAVAARSAFADAVVAPPFRSAEGLFYGPGHTWARLDPDGAVRVGIDDFVHRLLGRVDRVEAAPSGSELERQDAAFVLHHGDRSLGLAAPVEGTVTEVNEAVLRDPQHLDRDPLGAWLVLVRPRRLAEDLRRLRVAEEARTWMQSEVARLRDFLAAHGPAAPVGATLQDGGLPVDGVLSHLDAGAWERFESEFLT